jgi:hypothetical protein
MGEELALIIGRAPAVHPSVPDGRLEGGRVPGIQGLRGLMRKAMENRPGYTLAAV